jgi:hypothetical protein
MARLLARPIGKRQTRHGVVMEGKRLLDRVRDKIRVKHYSIRTEETYLQWCRRFIFFHNKRHP